MAGAGRGALVFGKTWAPRARIGSSASTAPGAAARPFCTSHLFEVKSGVIASLMLMHRGADGVGALSLHDKTLSAAARAYKDAVLERYHYDSHEQLERHLQNFVPAYNFDPSWTTFKGRRLASSSPNDAFRKVQHTGPAAGSFRVLLGKA